MKQQTAPMTKYLRKEGASMCLPDVVWVGMIEDNHWAVVERAYEIKLVTECSLQKFLENFYPEQQHPTFTGA